MKTSVSFRTLLKNFVLVSLLAIVTVTAVEEEEKINPIKMVRTFATLFFGGNPGPSHPLAPDYPISTPKLPMPARNDSIRSQSTHNIVTVRHPNATLSSPSNFLYNLASKFTVPLSFRLPSKPVALPPAGRGVTQMTLQSNRSRFVNPKIVNYYKPLQKLKQHLDYGMSRLKIGRGQGLNLNIRQNLLQTPLRMQFSSSNHAYNVHRSPIVQKERRGKFVMEESDTNKFIFTTEVILENLLYFLKQEFPEIVWSKR